jgi:hypothetical protein
MSQVIVTGGKQLRDKGTMSNIIGESKFPWNEVHYTIDK